MKKNKKYWKQQAESWREIAEMETDSANHWAGEYYLLHDEFEELELKFDIVKRELNTLRQYNIGKKTFTTGNGVNVDWKVYYKNPKSYNIEKDVVNWFNRNEKDPDWNNNPERGSAGCKCKNCNCNN